MEDRANHQDLQYLTVGLPEDIEKLKWYGDFERAARIIDMRLEKDIPEPLRRRLLMEKWVLKRLPLKYIYTEEEALRQLQETLEGATKEELERLRDEGAAEWIFVQGQVRYKDNFVENLLKTRKELWSRLKDPKKAEEMSRGKKLLDRTVAAMKEKGGLAYRMHIRASVQVEKEAERIGAFIRVHLPVPVEKGQVKNFKLLKTSEKPVSVAPPDYPQRTVCMETTLKPGQEFWVEYVFENHTGYTDLEDALKEENSGGESLGKLPDESLTPYVEEQLPHIRFTPYMKALAEEIVAGEENPLKKARKIYDYITTHIMYSFVRQYATIDNLPEYMATGMKGDCGIYALLFITLCRIAGIPARWQAGLYATPLSIGCHDWAQFYIKPYGWLYADCSFGGSAWRDGKKERWDFYFGNLDPFRIPMCSEFQYEFMPAKAFLREEPYDNQVGEAEYKDRGLIHGLEYQTDKQVLEIEEIPYTEG
ncbi:MAG: transglutaminase domain-containing protein [Hungatella sp.]|nr:transglutaminase domain-containing protein [Hungatella sp.]